MLAKTNIHQNDKAKVWLTSLGAWILTFATVIGTAKFSKELVRQPIVANATPSFHTFAGPDSSLWSRNDNENETVHMPTKFAVVRAAVVSGKK
jgi:hypothetical protein